MRRCDLRRRAGGLSLALALLALAPAARAQDGGDLDPGMLEVCPELKDAGPREREQLIALFFELDPRHLGAAQRERTKSLFDLGKPEDVAVLARYLDQDHKPPCLAGVSAVFLAHGDAGLVWLLERWASAPPPRRGRLIEVLANAGEQREVWQFLLRALRDRTPVPDAHAAAIAPPGYTDLRVCDHALRALGQRLRRVKEVRLPGDPADLRVDSTMPPDVRDARVQSLGKFLAADDGFQALLLAAPSVRDGAEGARAGAICDKLGLGAP